VLAAAGRYANDMLCLEGLQVLDKKNKLKKRWQNKKTVRKTQKHD